MVEKDAERGGAEAGERRNDSFRFGTISVRPGHRKRVQLPVARLTTGTDLSIPVEIVHGARAGPRIWISGAIHGDEVVGVEILRQVVRKLDPRLMAGTVVAVPIVNIYGFITESRYLPDRRDLNRSFPGSPRGSLAARLAHLFMTEVVGRCGYGIDLHSGSDGRTNLPQVRANLDIPETRRLALAFGAPVTVHSTARDRSLREAAAERGVRVLVYEGGEAHRFERPVVQAGVLGVRRVLDALGILPLAENAIQPPPSLEVRNTSWVRAARSGILRLETELGARIKEKQRLGVVSDSFGDRSVGIRSPVDGVVIGVAVNPLVNQGDALVHIAEVGAPPAAAQGPASPPAGPGEGAPRQAGRDGPNDERPAPDGGEAPGAGRDAGGTKR